MRFFRKVLRHTVGRYAGLPFLLQPWQRKLLRALFGWKRKRDGLLQVPVCVYRDSAGRGRARWRRGLRCTCCLRTGSQGEGIFGGGRPEAGEIVFEQASLFVQVNELLSQELEVLKREIRVRSDPGRRMWR